MVILGWTLLAFAAASFVAALLPIRMPLGRRTGLLGAAMAAAIVGAPNALGSRADQPLAFLVVFGVLLGAFVWVVLYVGWRRLRRQYLERVPREFWEPGDRELVRRYFDFE